LNPISNPVFGKCIPDSSKVLLSLGNPALVIPYFTFLFVGCSQFTRDTSLVVSFGWMRKHANRHFLEGHVAKVIARHNIIHVSLGPYMTLINSTLDKYEQIMSPPSPRKLAQICAGF